MEDFDFINDTYWQMFGISQLNVFFEERPRQWRLMRFVTYFFIFCFYPVYLVIELCGFIYGRKGDFQEISFGIGYVAFVIQTTIKIHYFVHKIEGFRSLCLDFETFHTSRHRPTFSRKILGNMAHFLRKLTKICYTLMYTNGFSWNLQLLLQPLFHWLKRLDVMASGPDTMIPKIFPIIYPFDEYPTRNRIFILVLEWVVLNAGLLYALPIDLFFVSVFMMVCAELDVICKSALTMEELKTAIDKDYNRMFGPDDDRNRIDMSLLIEDHQKVLRITKKIREIMSPMLGLAMSYFIVLLATLALTATAEIKSAATFSESLRRVPGLVAAIMSVLSTLYLYSWICGKLKNSEEALFEAVYSTNWYEKDKNYRDAVLIMMGQSFRSRPLRMMASGDMDRRTFFSGLKGIYSYYNFLMGFE